MEEGKEEEEKLHVNGVDDDKDEDEEVKEEEKVRGAGVWEDRRRKTQEFAKGLNDNDDDDH